MTEASIKNAKVLRSSFTIVAKIFVCVCIPGNIQSLGRSLFNAITDVLHCAAQRQMVCRNIIALASAMPQCPCGVNSNQCRAGDPQCNQDTVRRNSRAPETCQSLCNTFTLSITAQLSAILSSALAYYHQPSQTVGGPIYKPWAKC